jgi:hypothetical protein
MKSAGALFLSAVILAYSYLWASQVKEWREVKGDHFIVCFTEDEKFAKDALDKAEVYYRAIASDLGYPRYEEFWTWDKRVKVYIYPDQASFLEATHQPEWSIGVADYKNKHIASFVLSKGFLDSLLPHEIAHLVFRDFVGFLGEVPLWLDEGVAQWEEKEKRLVMKRMIKDLYEKDSLLFLSDIAKINIRSISDKGNVYIRATRTKGGKDGVVFLSSVNLVNTYYLQAVSLVGFLIEKHGSDNFAFFCRQLRDGKTMEEALQFSYPSSIRSLSELEDKWREYLVQEY